MTIITPLTLPVLFSKGIVNQLAQKNQIIEKDSKKVSLAKSKKHEKRFIVCEAVSSLQIKSLIHGYLQDIQDTVKHFCSPSENQTQIPSFFIIITILAVYG